ncbi:molybdopterin molybdenumtransferase MoeA [Acetobacter lambici]|nr:molybdopterin molybdotransferase MoeA [Acetobacter lambici]NHO57813.1 molybdopterin molybdenumtransferase MoeA [Acetobacter lambici]
MVEYEQAQSILSALIKTLPVPEVEYIPVSQADGRILARDLYALSPRPEADISAMDGYAFCCADIPDTSVHTTAIPLRDYVVAGDQPEPHQKGTAATILTGARLPAGANCVIARERVQISNGMLQLTPSDIAVGKNIRLTGEEFSAGALLYAARQKLDWRHIALLVSQNVKQVAVYKPCRVGVVASGAEFAPNAPDCRAEINTPILQAMLQSRGVHVLSRVVGSDSQQELLEAITELAAHSDILITTGGISVGQTDNVLPVMERLGASCVFRRVKIRPGKPFTLMLLGQKPVFCLPGNPGATAICAQFFVLPFLRLFMGFKPELSASALIGGRSNFAFTPAPDATCFVPVTYAQSGKEGVFSLVPSQGASDILCFSRADGILRIPAGHNLQVGDWCYANPFHPV